MSVLSHFHQAFLAYLVLRSHLPSLETSHNPPQKKKKKKTEKKNVKENQTAPGWNPFCHAEPYDSVKSLNSVESGQGKYSGW